MDEESVETGVPTVGDQLRAARTKKKLSLEDIAARTRIPLRHLESIEASDWAHLPAPTYTVGFAKSYAAEVDLDRSEIGDQLRAEMGNPRAVPVAPEAFEPADPARAMPKGLVIGAVIAVLLLVGLMSWFNSRSLSEGGEAELNQAAAAPATQPAAPAVAPVAQGPVVLSASAPVWIAVTDRSGASYFSGMLNPGGDFTVPATAPAPVLRTGKPEALKIMVGTALAPPVGPPGQRVSDVSLLPADLLKGGAATPLTAAPATATPPPPAAAPSRTVAPSRRRSPPPVAAPPAAPAQPPPASEPPPANTTG